MARNLDPKCRQCRREGEKLFLKGERCFTPKCPIIKRNYPPGQHGLKGKQRISGYGLQLREKQKVKRMYRILEAQLRHYFATASRRKGNTAEFFLQALELRLDNIVYRLNIGKSRDQARQFVRHGHILVNEKPVDLPSYGCSVGDTISVRSDSASSKLFEPIKKAADQTITPKWLEFDRKGLRGKVLYRPPLDELNQGIRVQLIVEYYSR